MSTTKSNIQGVCDTASKTVFTASGTSEQTLGSLMFFNQSGSSVTVRVFFVPSGATKSEDHLYYETDVTTRSTIKPNALISESLPNGTQVVLEADTLDEVNYRGWVQSRST